MKKRKNKIKILDHTYRIIYKKGLKDENGQLCGQCDSNKLTIEINTDLSDEMFKSTMLHEIVEAINTHLELGMTHKQIMGIETGMFKFFTY